MLKCERVYVFDFHSLLKCLADIHYLNFLQANSHQNQIDPTGGMELETSQLEFDVDLSDMNIQVDFENNSDGFGLMDVFVQMTENSQQGSPRHTSNPGSPGPIIQVCTSPTKMNGWSVVRYCIVI